jgi:hypothetical protein
MKPRFMILAALLASLLLAFGRAAWEFGRGKVGELNEAHLTRAESERASRIRTSNDTPAATLPRRPGDRHRYPRETFAITYLDGNGFGIDTARGVVHYDRISDSDTTIVLQLTRGQLDSLYDEALNDRMFEMVEPRPIGTSWVGAEHWGGVLTLKAGESKRSFRWDFRGRTEPWSEDYKRLNLFVANLKRMVQTSPAYLAQPRPRGLYID